jgi:hypothetical protein
MRTICLIIFLFTSLWGATITPLTDGYSGTKHDLIECVTGKFVWKIYPEGYAGSFQAKQELFSHKNAARLGLAPQIFWISSDERTLLIDFVEGELLTTAKAKEPATLIMIADCLRAVHSLPAVKETPRELLSLYRFLKRQSQIPKELDEAIRQWTPPPLGPKVTLHGDLNPRNIFLTKTGIQLIDWTETRLDDPFYYLSYFAFHHNYTDAEEHLLLETYLKRPVTEQELFRYQKIKQTTRLEAAITLIFLAYSLAKNLVDQEILPSTYYAAKFADTREELSAQFFYDWGKSCLY